jgi:fucose 4-O-acetylase-like acetyltransferase
MSDDTVRAQVPRAAADPARIQGTTPSTDADAPVVTRPRMVWMDVLRGLAILAVVVFHAGTLLRYADLELPEGLRQFNRAVAPFRIPMLVLLSGMLLPRSMTKGTRRYLEGKARLIVWPYLLWSGVIGAILWGQYGLASVKWLAPNVLIGGTYLWYLFFLIVFYVVALPLRRVPRLLVAAVCLVLAELAPDDTKYAERPAFLFALFVLGWWVAERPEVLRRAFAFRWTPVPALAVLVASYLVGDMSGYGPRAVLGTLAGVFLLGWLVVRTAEAPVVRPLSFVGRNSVVYYCVHFPLIIGIMTLGGLLGVEQPYVLVGLSAAAAVGAGTALARNRGRSALVRGLFEMPARRPVH